MTTFSTALEATPSPASVPPAPWMPLDALADLWAAFGREISSPAAALATSCAFAALADEREAVHLFNWLAPARGRAGATSETSLYSQLLGQESIIEALSRAATHWYDAARALLDVTEQPPAGEDQQQTAPRSHDLERLISSTLAQRLRVWAIAHSLLADQHRQLFPAQHEPKAEGQAK